MAFTQGGVRSRPRLGGGGPDTGGADIGAMAHVGGSIPGMTAVSAGAATLLPPVITHFMQKRAAKEFDDSEGDTTVGTEGGKVVKRAPQDFHEFSRSPTSPYPAI